VRVLIVIVNYRTADLAIDCLRSLAPQVSDDVKVIVTDNASGDGSVDRITSAVAREGWSSWASVMPLPTYGGFAYGNNAAIRPALESSDPPKYFYLLNPDTIALPGAVEQLAKFLDEHPQVGIAGGRAENPDGTVRRSVFRFHSPLGELEGQLRVGVISKALNRYIVAPPVPEKSAQADWVSGASMMIRREVFETTGLLDDGFFMYFEETDFCLRAKRAGWQTWYVPASRVIHLVGQSSGVTGAQRAAKRRPKYWFDSRHRFFLRHYGPVMTLLADLAWAGGSAVGNLIQKLRRKPRTDPPWLLWDFLRYNTKSWAQRL
jgi:GT2 family glycosyltransferase